MNNLLRSIFFTLCTLGISQPITASSSDVANVNNKTSYKIEVEAIYSFDQEECLGSAENEAALYRTIIQPQEEQQIPYSMGSSYECETSLQEVKITAFFDENDDNLPDKTETIYLGPFKSYTINEMSYGSEKIGVSTSSY